MPAGNLIVVDEYFTKLASKYEDYGRDVENAVEEYLSKLQGAREGAVVHGEAASALDEFIGYAEQLTGKAEAITSDLATLARGYIRDIDSADDFLF